MPDDALLPERLALALYAAVLDGAPVVDVLDDIRRAVGADSAWLSRLYFADGRPTGVERFEQIGFDPASAAEYVTQWVQHDPWVIASQGLTPGVHNYDRVVPLADYLGSPFWNEFGRRQPHAANHALAASIGGAPEVMGALALQRTGRAGAFGAAEERLVATLYPHLSRALLTEARLAEAGLQAAAAGAGLDALRQGVGVIAPGGRMVRANATLLDFAARADGLRLTAQGPASDDPVAQALLTRRVEAALATATRRHALPEAASFAIPRRSGGAWLAQVLTLNATATGLFAGFIGALVLISDPRRPALPLAQSVQSLLGLTRAEAELALALAAGKTLTDHAQARRVGLETLRTHLASIRRKTGCRRQTELVLLVASLTG